MSDSEVHCDILVIGAGFAGTIIANMLRQQGKHVMVIDAAPKPTKTHFAIMRFRDPTIGRPLGVNLREISVEKAAYWKGELHYHADIRMKNKYSLKTYGSLGHRSLGELGVVKRYLMDGTFGRYPSTIWNTMPKWFDSNEVNGRWCRVADNRFDDTSAQPVRFIYYNHCISTIPLPALLELFGRNAEAQAFEAKPIYVNRIKIRDGIASKVNQTIYFPSEAFHVYRASLEERELILESINSDILGEEMDRVIKAFGLEPRHFEGLASASIKQPLGKLGDIDDYTRRKVIYGLTDAYGIFSLGRFAIWKPIRSDQLIDDAEKVLQMINMGVAKFSYARRLSAGA